MAEGREADMDRIPLANWNGVLAPLDEVKVSVLDRGFLFGDGVYEAMRLYSGRVFLLEEHWARLRRSLSELSITVDLERLRGRLLQTVTASGVKEGLVYLQVTRGSGSRRTHAFPRPAVVPNELIWVDGYESTDPNRDRRVVGVEAITFPDLRWARRDIKSINLLPNCLAAEQAKKVGVFEAILVDSAGIVTEGSHTSLFAVRAGRLLTYPSGPEILPGCTRAFVMRLASRVGVETEQSAIHRQDLAGVDELFLTGTTSEILGIVKVDGEKIGNGQVGPITSRLAAAYQSEVKDWLTTRTTMT
jgi:D-alanine transaminase